MKKLDPPLKEPGLVVSTLGTYVYKIRLQHSTLIVNHDRLKKCNDRYLPDWLLEAREKFQRGENIVDHLDQLYYICRKPDDGSFMIECNYCEDWFHGACVQVTENKLRALQSTSAPDIRPHNYILLGYN